MRNITHYNCCFNVPKVIILKYQIPPGFTLEYARGDGAWQSVSLAGTARSHALRQLACGASYRLRLTAHNAAGSSATSEVLSASTSGGC